MEKFKNKIRKKILDIGFDSVGFTKPTVDLKTSKYFWREIESLQDRGDLLEKISNQHPDILENINTSGKLEDEIKNKLVEIIELQKKGSK